MRIARVATPDGVAFAALDGEHGSQVAAEILDHPFGPVSFTGRSWPLADVRLLAPILPTKIVGMGKNYAEHAAEMGGEPPATPVMFLKPNTAVIGPGAPIKLPVDSERVDYEGELAAVIGRPCKDVPAARAADVLLGYTVANDVTARDQQQADGQWTRAKSHDTFCPLGPWLETELDPFDLRVRCEVDEVLREDGRTRDLITDVPAVLAYITSFMTLLPGDVVLTGTPPGVGPLQAGDTVEVGIEGIGLLENPVIAGG